MRQRRLGTGGPSVGAVCLGCMGMTYAYGPGERDDAQSVAVLGRAVELGVTLIDTADVYGPFDNEELVGGTVWPPRTGGAGHEGWAEARPAR